MILPPYEQAATSDLPLPTTVEIQPIYRTGELVAEHARLAGRVADVPATPVEAAAAFARTTNDATPEAAAAADLVQQWQELADDLRNVEGDAFQRDDLRDELDRRLRQGVAPQATAMVARWSEAQPADDWAARRQQLKTPSDAKDQAAMTLFVRRVNRLLPDRPIAVSIPITPQRAGDVAAWQAAWHAMPDDPAAAAAEFRQNPTKFLPNDAADASFALGWLRALSDAAPALGGPTLPFPLTTIDPADPDATPAAAALPGLVNRAAEQSPAAWSPQEIAGFSQRLGGNGETLLRRLLSPPSELVAAEAVARWLLQEPTATVIVPDGRAQWELLRRLADELPGRPQRAFREGETYRFGDKTFDAAEEQTVLAAASVETADAGLSTPSGDADAAVDRWQLLAWCDRFGVRQEEGRATLVVPVRQDDGPVRYVVVRVQFEPPPPQTFWQRLGTAG